MTALCDVCSGVGQVRCDTCGGSGTLPCPDPECVMCQSGQYPECGDCDGRRGYMMCPLCEGNGRVRK